MFFLVLACFVLPLLATLHFTARWDFSREPGHFGSEENWWVWHVPAPAAPFKVEEVMRTILLREDRILKDPAPRVRTVKYNDFSIDYELKFCLADYALRRSVKDALMTQILYAFRFYGIEIPFPIRAIYPKGAKSLEKEPVATVERIGNVRGFLQRLPYFNQHLTLSNFDSLADNCFRRRYRPGEHVILRGELGDAVDTVREKWCEVALSDGQRRRLDAGQYFGERGS